MAIKSLSKERMQNSTMEFMKEYEIMQTIQHENIVRYYHILFVKPKQHFFSPEIIIIQFVVLDCLEWFWIVQES